MTQYTVDLRSVCKLEFVTTYLIFQLVVQTIPWWQVRCPEGQEGEGEEGEGGGAGRVHWGADGGVLQHSLIGRLEYYILSI